MDLLSNRFIKVFIFALGLAGLLRATSVRASNCAEAFQNVQKPLKNILNEHFGLRPSMAKDLSDRIVKEAGAELHLDSIKQSLLALPPVSWSRRLLQWVFFHPGAALEEVLFLYSTGSSSALLRRASLNPHDLNLVEKRTLLLWFRSDYWFKKKTASTQTLAYLVRNLDFARLIPYLWHLAQKAHQPTPLSDLKGLISIIERPSWRQQLTSFFSRFPEIDMALTAIIASPRRADMLSTLRGLLRQNATAMHDLEQLGPRLSFLQRTRYARLVTADAYLRAMISAACDLSLGEVKKQLSDDLKILRPSENAYLALSHLGANLGHLTKDTVWLSAKWGVILAVAAAILSSDEKDGVAMEQVLTELGGEGSLPQIATPYDAPQSLVDKDLEQLQQQLNDGVIDVETYLQKKAALEQKN